MRIAVLMSLASPWSQATVEMLTRLGHEIHAIDFEEGKGAYFAKGEEDIARVQKITAGVHLLSGYGSSNFRYFRAIPAFRKLLREINPDILLTLYAGGFAQLAWLSRFRPYAVFAVGSDVLLQSGLRKIIARRTFESASEVFANGDYLAQKAREMAPDAKITPLLLGVDTDRFTPPPGHIPGPIQIICNRGFKPVYNNESIIRALAALAGAPPFTFHFTSPGESLNAAKALAFDVLPKDVYQRVIFHGGVSSEKMLELLRASQIFVSMSRSDGTATSLLEALSCGLFPILSDIPQNRGWIDPEKQNGLLVPLDNIASLANALDTALRNPSIIQSASAHNRQLALNRADSKRNLQTLATALQKITAP